MLGPGIADSSIRLIVPTVVYVYSVSVVEVLLVVTLDVGSSDSVSRLAYQWVIFVFVVEIFLD